MKPYRWKIFPYLFVLVLSSCTSCNEPDPTVLPAETQSGKNTFGCYVNKDLYVGGFTNLTGPAPLSAVYNKNTHDLFIISYGVLKNRYQQIISLEIYSPVVDSFKVINNGYYESQDVNQNAYYTFKNSGYIYINKLDTIGKIVSGRFQFVGKNSGMNANDSIVVTNGRFDLKLTTNN